MTTPTPISVLNDGIFGRIIHRRQHSTNNLPSLDRMNVRLARVALFVVYFWFGVLKLAGVSSAGPLVTALWQKTIPFIPLDVFMVLFSCYEMLIGVLFLIPALKRLAIGLLLLHVSMTVLPLALLPDIVWKMFLVPSLEGQYIIKNIVMVALALSLAPERATAGENALAEGKI